MIGWRRVEIGTFSDLFRLLGRIWVFLLFWEILEVRVHLLGPCGRSGEVRSRHAITLWSRVTGWQRAEVGTVSDLLRLLGRIWVFLLVL